MKKVATPITAHKVTTTHGSTKSNTDHVPHPPPYNTVSRIPTALMIIKVLQYSMAMHTMYWIINGYHVYTYDIHTLNNYETNTT